MKKKKLIIIAISSFFALTLISVFINNAFFKPTKLNAFIAAKIYQTPANVSFTDDNFYKCVIDSYNAENPDNELQYTTAIADDELESIKNLKCTARNFIGIEKLTGLQTLELSGSGYGEILNLDLTNSINLKKITLNAGNDNLIAAPSSYFVENSSVCNFFDMFNNMDKLEELTINGQPSCTFRDSLYNFRLFVNFDLSEATNLKKLNLESNGEYITSIDLTNNVNLENLNITSTDIETLTLSKNSALETLDITSSLIESLDLTGNRSLKSLNLNSNEKIKELNLTKNNSLKSLNLTNNTYLNSIDLTNNILLEDLKIEYSDLNDTNIQSLNLKQNSKLKTLDITNSLIESLDLTGNGSLKSLNLTNNTYLNTINLTKNVLLEDFYLSYSNLAELNLTNNSSLKDLNVTQNSRLNSINLAGNSSLVTLNVSQNNRLNSINLAGNTSLADLNITNNSNLKTLDISNLDNLENLDLSSNALETFSIPKNILKVVAENNLLTSIDLTKAQKLTELNVTNNNLKTLDFSNCTYFKSLKADNNSNLEYVNLENSKYVETIDLGYAHTCNGKQDEYNTCLNNKAFRGKVNLNLDITINPLKASSYRRTGVFSSTYPEYYSCPSHTYDFVFNFFDNYKFSYIPKYPDLSEGNGYRQYDNDVRYCETTFASGRGFFRETNAIYLIKLTSNSYFIDINENFIDIYDEKISNNILDNLSLNYGEMRINNDKLQVLFDNEVIKEFDIRTTYVSPISINNKALANTINNDNKWYKGYNGSFSFDITANDETFDLNTLNVSVIKNNSDVSHIFNIHKELVDDKLTVNVYNITASCDIGDYYVNISDSNEVIDTLLFTISEPTKVSNITTENVEIVNVDEIIDINYKILPENATNKQLELIIADESIAIIENGKIKGLKEGETTLTLKATDGSNIVKTITIKVIDFDIKTDKYDIDNNLVIKKIKDKLLFNSFINDFTVNSDINIKVFNNDVEIDYTKPLGTGHKLKTYSNDELLNEYTLIVSGDINGDGQANAADIIFMKSHILGKSTLDGILFKAGDIDENNSVNATDIIYLKSYILGKTNNVWGS